MPTTYSLYTFLAPCLQPLYQFVADYLGQQLHIRLDLVVGQTYDDIALADFCFVCGLPYILRTPPYHRPLLQVLAAPVLPGSRYQDKPIYFSDVIVHRDHPAASFADLRGGSWAFNEPESQSGYGITRYHLVTRGETNGFFGQVIQAGFHQEAIRRVAAREVDATAIDSHVLAIELRDHPELAHHIKIIDTLGPSTIQPFTAAPHIPMTLQADVQRVLAEMHLDPEAKSRLEQYLVERFARVEDADYNDIRRMLTACEQAQFLTLR
ncbi:MAG TPA: PhnD/SsuA/transferrin family substrate-binding protein [Phototrophicaceae bacterium]|nr:PhnD/SsuA/transferrin family substrate-binding protein [Phototrophicaceae bacterium]